MPQPLTLATLAVLAAAGSVTGVYLGRSAIGEINPAYHDEPETRFHADLVPNRASFSAPVTRAGYLTPAERQQALGGSCVGCRTYPEEYYPVHDSSVDKYQPGYAEMVEVPAPQPAVYEPAPQEEERAADFAAVERYASYPVVAEAAVAAVPAAEVEFASASDGEALD